MKINIEDKVEKFIGTLESTIVGRVLRTIDLLEKFGHSLGLPHSKSLGRGLFELRIRGNTDIRIFYTFHKNEIILFHGFVKKSSNIPRKELIIAKSYLKGLT